MFSNSFLQYDKANLILPFFSCCFLQFIPVLHNVLPCSYSSSFSILRFHATPPSGWMVRRRLPGKVKDCPKSPRVLCEDILRVTQFPLLASAQQNLPYILRLLLISAESIQYFFYAFICKIIFWIMTSQCNIFGCISLRESAVHLFWANDAWYCIPMVIKVKNFNYWRMEKTGVMGENIISSQPNIMIIGQNCGGCSSGL